ncbi:MAG TPA: wax ester/triacylglycerol synthase domain-containing protein [Baekduia sp.]|nr:wax ester/triacylglycerol synthase domain-containing protein [Baekduia sp.]
MTTQDTTGEVLEWGATPDLNALETIMWRAEVDPRLRSTVIMLEVLDTAPDWERLLAAHEWGSRVVPRFRQRVVDGPGGLGQPVWVTDPSFSLDRHVRRRALPEGGGAREMLDIVAQVGMEPFDRARPPWEGTLLEGLPDGRAAYVLKMHHSTLDGIAGMQLLGRLHSPTREPRPDKPMPPVPEPGSTSSLAAIARTGRRDLGRLAGVLRDAPGHLGALRRPDRSAREAVEWAASLRRVLGDPEATPSPLLAGRSGRWNLGTLDVPFQDLRAAAKSAGGSLNDAFVAALLGGIRRYHEVLGATVSDIPIAIPISVRKEDDPAGGNRFVGARLAAPAGEPDPVKRIQAVGRAVRAIRDEPALEGLGSVAPALARLPGPLLAHVVGSLTSANDLQASNVQGLREEAFLAGAKIERMYGFAPVPGCALMITLITHGDVGCVGVNADPAAVTDLDLLGRSLADSFGEVLALVPGAGAATWSG